MTSFFSKIQAGLVAHSPLVLDADDKKKAAVAVVLNVCGDGLRLLFIERAAHPKDPWSGHIAFPGGTIEVTDRDLKHTAERETMEELGLDLSVADYLGRLDDVTGATLPVQVSGFVYGVYGEVVLCPNDEVCEAFWTPFSHLMDLDRRCVLQLKNWQPLREAPAIDLLGAGRPVLWGLTYRLVAQLLGFVGHALPMM